MQNRQLKSRSLVSRTLVLDLSRPQVMGILNITPDSFSDGGKYQRQDQALQQAEKMVNAGAAIIDVGGESTRPGAAEVSTALELERVIPVIEALKDRLDVWISVDTSKPEVMRAAVKAGAHLINDVRSLQYPGALTAAAESGLPVCLMHMRGQPSSMQQAPNYVDLMAEVKQFFSDNIARCLAAGIDRQRLILDPGFGFGKTLEHNYQLLANLAELHVFDLPLLVGMSRKSMIGRLLNAKPENCLAGSLACAVMAAMQGAHIIRVHDVQETVEAIRVVTAVSLQQRI